MTREELKEHCKKQVEQIEMWAKHRGEEPSGRIYEEHKLVLELLEQESYEDAISRESVIEILENYGCTNKEGLLFKDINALTSIQPKPKTGHWIAVENEEMETDGYYCSECDLPMETEQRTNFCPNCGAKMVESEVNNG